MSVSILTGNLHIILISVAYIMF